MDAAAVAALAPAVRSCASLVSLDCSANAMGVSGALELVRVLAFASALQCLSLAGTRRRRRRLALRVRWRGH